MSSSPDEIPSVVPGFSSSLTAVNYEINTIRPLTATSETNHHVGGLMSVWTPVLFVIGVLVLILLAVTLLYHERWVLLLALHYTNHVTRLM